MLEAIARRFRTAVVPAADKAQTRAKRTLAAEVATFLIP